MKHDPPLWPFFLLMWIWIFMVVLALILNGVQ